MHEDYGGLSIVWVGPPIFCVESDHGFVQVLHSENLIVLGRKVALTQHRRDNFEERVPNLPRLSISLILANRSCLIRAAEKGVAVGLKQSEPRADLTKFCQSSMPPNVAH